MEFYQGKYDVCTLGGQMQNESIVYSKWQEGNKRCGDAGPWFPESDNISR